MSKFGHVPNVSMSLSVIGCTILFGAKALMGVLAMCSVKLSVWYFQQLKSVAYQFLQQVSMYVNK